MLIALVLSLFDSLFCFHLAKLRIKITKSNMNSMSQQMMNATWAINCWWKRSNNSTQIINQSAADTETTICTHGACTRLSRFINLSYPSESKYAYHFKYYSNFIHIKIEHYLPAKNFFWFIFGIESFGCIFVGQQIVFVFFAHFRLFRLYCNYIAQSVLISFIAISLELQRQLNFFLFLANCFTVLILFVIRFIFIYIYLCITCQSYHRKYSFLFEWSM